MISAVININITTTKRPLNGFDSYVSGIVSNQDYKEEFEKYLREPLLSEKYLREPLLSRTQNFDILLWWKHQEVNYPTLRLIAKDILAIPISTVILESAFSTSGRLLCENCSTDPKTVEAHMCNQNWIRNTTKKQLFNGDRKRV
ncbi:Putative AC transposase [Linum perenne]